MHEDGLQGQNGALLDSYGLNLTRADSVINQLSAVTVSVITTRILQAT